MELRQLGDSGIEVSIVGLGGNNFGRALDRGGSRAVITEALEAGITFFDTADGYGGGASERYLGEFLRPHRDEVVIATKFGGPIGPDWGIPRGSPSHARRAVEESLARLRLDHVDILYYHWPDSQTPIEETLGELWRFVDEGKARAIGCSNFDASQLAAAERAATQAGRPHFSVLQNDYSLASRGVEPEILPFCAAHDIGFVAFLPLASGLLTGKYRFDQPAPEGSRVAGLSRPIPQQQWRAAERAARFAEEHGIALLELALGALLSRPGVSSILAGATRPEQVRANVAAAGARLSPGELDELTAALDAQTTDEGGGPP
jgi:aryl-alcohol dehydrogenase-like predicted oxidoreductase